MMRRSQKHRGSGGKEYFNEKRPVNLWVDAQQASPRFYHPSAVASPQWNISFTEVLPILS